MRVIIRMWTEEGYHKDVAFLDENQVHMYQLLILVLKRIMYKSMMIQN